MPHGFLDSTSLYNSSYHRVRFTALKVPNNDSLYYYFRMTFTGLSFDIINMKADSNNGDVISKMNLINTYARSDLYIVKHANDSNYWLINCPNNYLLYAYLITSTGINSTPVVSTTLFRNGSNFYFNNTGNKLVLGDVQNLYLYDFNSATGKATYNKTIIIAANLSNWTLNFLFTDVSVFEPNDSLFYFTVQDYNSGATILFQINPFLALPALSLYPISSDYPNDMLLAPDGKIYISHGNSIISCIIRPNEGAYNSTYIYNYLNVYPGVAGGLPRTYSKYRKLYFTSNAHTQGKCVSDSVRFTLHADSMYQGFTWFFYSNNGQLIDSSLVKNPSKWLANGSYFVKVRALNTECSRIAYWADSVYVNHSPGISLYVDSSRVACARYTSYLSYKSAFADSVRFFFGDGSFTSWLPADSAGSVSHTYSDSSHVYRVVAVAKNSTCTDSAVVFDTVVLHPRPRCGFVLPAPVVKGCVPFSFVITDTSRFADSVWYRVSGNGLSFFSGSTVTLTDTGYFTLVQYVHSPDGCIDSLVMPGVVFADAALHADAGLDTVICKGQSVRLAASGGMAYAWKNNASLSDTAVFNPMASPLTSTTYYVQVSNRACTAWDSVRVTVRDALRLVPVSSFALCRGQSTVLFVSSSGGDTAHVMYTLSSALLGPVTSHSGSFYLSPSRTDTFVVVVRDGCSPPDSASFVVRVYDSLQVHVPFTDTLICAGQSLRLSASASGGKPGSRVFDVNDGARVVPMADSSLWVSPTVTTLYYIRVSDGCSPPDSLPVRVRVLPALAHAALYDTLLCTGDTLLLNASPHGGDSLHYAFTWLDAGSGVLLASAAQLRLAASASLPVALHITDGLCTMWADTFVLGVIPINLFSTRDTVGCAPFTLHLSCSGISTPASRVFFTAFDPGDASPVVRKSFVSNSTVPDLLHTYTDTGTFSVYVVLFDAYGNALCHPFQQRVHVLASPVAAFDMSTHNVDLVHPVVRFQNHSLRADSCRWDMGDGSVVLSRKDFDHAYTQAGKYIVRLTAFNRSGCSDTLLDSLVAGNQFSIFIPNSFSPNGDGLNDAFFPVCFFTRSYSLQVFNRWGEQVFVSEANDPYPRWEPTDAQQGMYLYIIQATDGNGLEHKYQGRVVLVN